MTPQRRLENEGGGGKRKIKLGIIRNKPKNKPKNKPRYKLDRG